jgi:hypothetical protein
MGKEKKQRKRGKEERERERETGVKLREVKKREYK